MQNRVYKASALSICDFTWKSNHEMGKTKPLVFPHLTSQEKNLISPFAIFKKKVNLTIDPLSLGIFAPDPQLSTYRPQILRGVRI